MPTARLPDGWRDRLVRYETPNTNGVVAWCLELHDLWLSKAIAGRPKDDEFCRALLKERAVNPPTLLDRLERVPSLQDGTKAAVAAKISRWSGS